MSHLALFSLNVLQFVALAHLSWNCTFCVSNAGMTSSCFRVKEDSFSPYILVLRSPDFHVLLLKIWYWVKSYIFPLSFENFIKSSFALRRKEGGACPSEKTDFSDGRQILQRARSIWLVSKLRDETSHVASGRWNLGRRWELVLTPVPACQECVICSFFKYIIKNGGEAGGLAGEKWRKKAKKKKSTIFWQVSHHASWWEWLL